MTAKRTKSKRQLVQETRYWNTAVVVFVNCHIVIGAYKLCVCGLLQFVQDYNCVYIDQYLMSVALCAKINMCTSIPAEQ